MRLCEPICLARPPQTREKALGDNNAQDAYVRILLYAEVQVDTPRTRLELPWYNRAPLNSPVYEALNR
jgi:hypothetical protein